MRQRLLTPTPLPANAPSFHVRPPGGAICSYPYFHVNQLRHLMTKSKSTGFCVSPTSAQAQYTASVFVVAAPDLMLRKATCQTGVSEAKSSKTLS